jgi:hypothetical protein
MGVDINGRKPTSMYGIYFVNNWSCWHPLADYCLMIAPDICAACKAWHSNAGDGLDAAGALALAEALQKELDAGRTETYAQRYASEREMMPKEPCDGCDGTGVAKPVPPDWDAVSPNWDEGENPFPLSTDDLKGGGKCWRCQGTGYVRPWAYGYVFWTANVAAFVIFLRESGGFSIY